MACPRTTPGTTGLHQNEDESNERRVHESQYHTLFKRELTRTKFEWCDVKVCGGSPERVGSELGAVLDSRFRFRGTKRCSGAGCGAGGEGFADTKSGVLRNS